MFYGVSFNVYIGSKATLDFLERKGYTVRTVGSIIRELRPKFKTKKQTLEELKITRGLYESLIAYKPGTMYKIYSLTEKLTSKLEEDAEHKSGNTGTYILYYRPISPSSSESVGDYLVDRIVRKETRRLLGKELDLNLNIY